jgi:hypothetical protein
LGGTLVESGEIQLIGLDMRTDARDRNVHGAVDCDGGVHRPSREKAGPSVPGAAAGAGKEPEAPAVASAGENAETPAVLEGGTPSRRDVPVPSVAADAGDLQAGLLDQGAVRLVGRRGPLPSGMRLVERCELRMGDLRELAQGDPAPAIAGGTGPQRRLDRLRLKGPRRRRGERPKPRAHVAAIAGEVIQKHVRLPWRTPSALADSVPGSERNS